jgi:hypothetical protein
MANSMHVLRSSICPGPTNTVTLTAYMLRYGHATGFAGRRCNSL